MIKKVLVCFILMTAGSFVAAPSFGFDIPKPGKDKPKKDDKKNNSATKGDSAPADSNAGAANTSDPAPAPKGDATDEVSKSVEALVDKALAAYNADDWKAFYADYCKSMAGIATEQAFTTLYRGMYRPKFGNYVSRSLIKGRSTFSPDGPGVFQYDAVFEKDKTANIAVNYMKEDGKLKLMQVQFNPGAGAQTNAATPPAAAGAPAAGAVHEAKVAKSAWDKAGLGSSKAGDWAEYEYPANKMKTRQEIVEIGDHTMTLETTSFVAGQQVKSKVKMIYSEPDNPEVQGRKVETKEFPDSATVAKGTFAGTRYETYIDGKPMGKMWMSKDIPITGMVKAEDAEGKPTMVLTDFGRK